MGKNWISPGNLDFAFCDFGNNISANYEIDKNIKWRTESFASDNSKQYGKALPENEISTYQDVYSMKKLLVSLRKWLSCIFF